jgi:hypothetical protein
MDSSAMDLAPARRQEEAWEAITRAAAEAGGGSGPLSLSNLVLLASGTA